MLYPVKNLLPPTSNPLWVKHANAVAMGEYHWKINQTGAYQTTSLPLTLKAGVVYTLSAEGMTDKAQLYVKRVIDGVPAYHIVSVSSGLSLSFTTVANAIYSLEFHNGTTLGEGYVLNYQLEEGNKTSFEPYRLGNKKAAMNKESLFPDMSGAASHAFVALNVFTVSKKVKLRKAKLNVATTGTFNISVQEWQDGVGLIGSPIYQKDQTLNSTGLMDYDFGGVVLEKGKTYAIGRYNQTGAAGVFRTTNAPNPNSKYVTWLGGTTPNNTSIVYPTTYYYFYGMEIESFEDNKPAVLPSKKNLVPSFSKWNRSDAFTINNDRKMTGVFSQSVIKSSDITLDVEVGKDYVLTGKITGQGRIRVGKKSNNALIGTIQPEYPIVSFKATEPQILLSVDNNYGSIPATTVIYEDIQLEKGTVQTPYTPFEPMNKPLIFNPRKNLIPDFKDSRWFNDMSVGGGTMVVDPTDSFKMKLTLTASAQGRLIWIPVEAGKTYTFSFGKIDGLYRIYKRKVGNHDNAMALVQNGGAGLPLTYTFTPDADYQGFITIRLTQGSAGTFSFEQLKLEEGPDKTPFQLYVNNMKPAVLYPQKNLLPKMSEWTYTNAAGKVSFPKDYRLELQGDTAGLYYNQHTIIKKNQKYTVSVETLTANARVAIREVKANSSKVFVTNLTTGNQSYTWTPAIDTEKIEVDCTTNGTGLMIFENVQLEEGEKTPFEPLKLGNKK